MFEFKYNDPIHIIPELFKWLREQNCTDGLRVVRSSDFSIRVEGSLCYDICFESGYLCAVEYDIYGHEFDSWIFFSSQLDRYEPGAYEDLGHDTKRYAELIKAELGPIIKSLEKARLIYDPADPDDRILGYSEWEVVTPLVWFRFGGDPIWREILETRVSDLIEFDDIGLLPFEYDPTEAVIGYTGDSPISSLSDTIRMPHPFYGNEPKPFALNEGLRTCYEPDHYRRKASYIRRLSEAFHILHRTRQDRVKLYADMLATELS